MSETSGGGAAAGAGAGAGAGAASAVGVKDAARATVQAATAGLEDLSHRIHAHPELGFEEERASAWVAESLSAAGFDVETGVASLPTAFVATAGSGPLTIGICAEYDALPGIGHACGHNVIAASAVGAALGLAPLADELGITVKVLGTPAEEGGGGKIIMLERGAFEGVHVAMMVHPAPLDMVQMQCLAVAHLDVEFHGKEAHASAFPEQGLNAADALTVSQVAIGLLRQHFRGRDQVHGIVTKGGEAPNIVPAHTSAKYYIRSDTLSHLDRLQPRVIRCFEAGALATGTQMEYRYVSAPYSEFSADDAISSLYKANAEALGRRFLPGNTMGGGSTDMANISLAIPAIHPMVGIDSLPAVNHQPEFTAACITPAADKAIVDGAVAMAWTTVDLATDDTQRDRLMSRAR
ncbi:MAG TPA: M20 family metallopeptidase [Acidimicrobiales bacterium]|nr:M20 family metallopeptidase [Acidimicrobiales bacterium]